MNRTTKLSHDAHAHGSDIPGYHPPHTLPLWLYYAVFGTLVFLTVVTVAVSYADLGPLAFPVAMLVALVKAGFVAGYFMHLKYDDRFISFLFIGSVLTMGLFFAFTFLDLGSRGMVNPETDNFTLREEAAAAEKAANPTPAAPAPAATGAHGAH